MADSLYTLAGGERQLHRLAHAFYDRVLVDPLLLPLFRDPEEEHAERLTLWLTELLGGPAVHSEVRGGFAVMAAAHHGLRISETQRQRWVEHMRAACVEVGLSDEFVQRFRPYLDGGSTFALRVSQ